MKYRIFGKSGVKVSELAFGAMTFDTEYGFGPGLFHPMASQQHPVHVF
jgi:aryl-alcohol dehydrogenase-like predicted oxidoreductase